MNYDSLSTCGPAGSRGSLILAFALVLGFGIASFNDSAAAAVSELTGHSAAWIGASSSGVIILARKDDNDDKDGKHGNKNGNKNGNANKGDRNWSKNDNKDGNGNGNKNWSRNGNGNKGNKNWSKNDKGWNGDGYKNWNKNGRKYGKGWGNYNDNWNRNWNHRGYVREWNRKPYYGEFIGGVILGSIFAANGIGVVPYPPAPYLCWYWADPFMYRGYWDYCDY